MKQENIDFLEANRHHYITLTRAFYMRCLNANEREGMVRVMREEFQPGYNTDLWCSPCVADMVKLLYQRYDAWLEQQPKEEPPVNPEPPEEPAAPPVIENVHATFPLQEKNSHELHTPHSAHRPARRARRK